MFEIYTLGHSNYPFDKLIKILKKLGYTYIYMADEFGVKRKSRESYNSEGYADFEKVILEESFKKGIERLKVGCKKGYKIVLLAAMQEPIRCPRAILVGRQLIKEGFDVKHIMHEGNLKTQDDLENYLLEKYFNHRNQLTFDNLLGNAMTKEEMINESYKLANKEIGYRIEKLDNK